MRTFGSPDGVRWGVEVSNPVASNAIVVFRHPNGRSSGLDRYNWYISRGPEARSVTARLVATEVLKSLTDADLARLFARSMPVTTSAPTYNPKVASRR